jgi:putative membrane protein
MAYLWVKWIHVISIISWMAGLLYLIRLFVYHSESINDESNHKLLLTMEHRLLRYITNPAMIAAWAAGLTMIAMNPALMQGKWLHHKITLVVLMSGVTGWASAFHKKIKRNNSVKYSSKTLRIINEIPTLLMMGIVWLVLFRPF